MRGFRGQIREEKDPHKKKRIRKTRMQVSGDGSQKRSGSEGMHSEERTENDENGDEWETPVQSACESKTDAVFFEYSGVPDGTDGAHRQAGNRREKSLG